jgi:hypothetical protein
MELAILTPAYGRDYKFANDVLTDFNNNKDFILNDMFSPYNGKYCNKSDIKNTYKQVKIRFNKLQNIILVRL